MTIGLIANNDGTGAVQLGGSNAISLDTSLNATMAGYVNAPNTFGFKNRIINGAMQISQSAGGASVTPTTTTNGFPVDRFQVSVSQNSKLTTQQSTTAATGFTNSLLVTSSSAYSITSSDIFVIRQSIEGFNFCDLGFGTASAAPVTLSFWVRSSLTGTFGGSLTNYAATRSYPFTYTISAANTWEQKTVTIAGDTSGTWVGASNAGAASLWFGLGVGSTSSGTTGAWAGADYRSATGATSVVGTSGATFYITGVQLEKGSKATSFDYLDYGRSLIQCQRYFYGRSGAEYYSACYWQSTTQWNGCVLQYPVTMRAAPVFTFAAASNFSIGLAGGSVTAATIGASSISTNSANISGTVASGGTGNAGGVLVGGASASISISAEL